MPFDVLNAYRKGPLGTSKTFRDSQNVSQEGRSLPSSSSHQTKLPEWVIRRPFPEVKLNDLLLI